MLSALLVSLTLAAPQGTSTAAGPEALLARAKQAMGGGRWDTVTTTYARARLRSGGLEGTSESWTDVRRGRYVTRYALGPAKGAEGFDGEVAWSQDDSGRVRVEESAGVLQASANEAYRTALAYWYPRRWPAAMESAGERHEGERVFDVVRITPRGGRPFELWLDRATGLLDRYSEQEASRTRTVFYSSYRGVEGKQVAFTTRATTGDARYDSVVELTSVDFDEPVADALFAPPAPPPPDFTIAGGKTSTTVPFELVNDHVYVDVRLNGRGPFRLLCDTGGANVVTPDLAAQLGLLAQGALEGRGVGEKSEDVAVTRIARVAIGDATLEDQLFFVMPLASMSQVEGVPVRGLVGYEVFARFVVRLDYAGRALTLTRPEAFTHDGKGTVVPFRFEEHTPEVDGTIDGIPGVFSIDTGARGALTLHGPFVEEHGLRERYGAKLEAVTGWGVGGPVRAGLGRAGVLTLGGVRVEKPVVELSLQREGAFTDRYVAGNVGGGILRRYTLTLDYGKQRIVFEPNAEAGQPFVRDRSGLWLNLAAKGFEVKDVVAGGPAARAGVRVGDVVVAVDGKAARELKLPALRERLRASPPGTRVELTIERGGEQRKATIELRDLV